MPEDRAFRQDIRPLKILILNLMPNKIATETQLLRVLSNSPLQVDIDLLYTASYVPKNTTIDHLTKFYETFDDVFHIPHSRHTEVRRDDILARSDLRLLSESEESGVYAVSDFQGRRIFVTGHSEYDATTLRDEYTRDIDKGLPIDLPKNYFPDDDPAKMPVHTWRSSATLLFTNWLNYYVYQETPFDLSLLTNAREES